MNPFKLFRAMVLAFGMASALALASPSAAGPTVAMRESCDGTVKFPSPDVLTFQGIGVSTHMGRYAISGGNVLTKDGQILNGKFTSVASDGSTIAGVYHGNFFPIGGGLVQFNVFVKWQVGTGRLQDVTGSGDVVAILDVTTGLFHYDTDAAWDLP